MMKIKIHYFPFKCKHCMPKNSVGFLTRRKLVYFIDDVVSSMCVLTVLRCWYNSGIRYLLAWSGGVNA